MGGMKILSSFWRPAGLSSCVLSGIRASVLTTMEAAGVILRARAVVRSLISPIRAAMMRSLMSAFCMRSLSSAFQTASMGVAVLVAKCAVLSAMASRLDARMTALIGSSAAVHVGVE